MVKKEVSFSDGTRIFYEEKDGVMHRYIEYAINPLEREEMEKKPYLKRDIESKPRKHNVGKYYYLETLRNLASSLSDGEKKQLYNDLKELHDKVGKKYDSSIVTRFPEIFGKYWSYNSIQCSAFFVTIYLAMLDLEENKEDYPTSLGKTMVLKSCEAVLLLDKSPKEAATMFSRTKTDYIYDKVGTEFLSDSRYEKYGGYNDFDDDTIDDAFDGFPEATWNVD